ncbi:hypothetical protein BD309DRAFT_1031064 [Dichomitus squalens]|uniref:Uncharacterized protein n=2 Tax=Dichomitus squalens TaxID=114155 RepID=A0A4Q9MIF8_9APHY|nr:uncharacterized protein DICSQDRAFT_64767 [Dichomitus squalens LYAD-421 SS1]EJF59554.1 hypothetical protein DICSQDRAFT_64767 [Dichomitus squalens LYAD-421 SS1]TBU25942.1 hypothetical protein BD311DRAFT_468243 [Dichomitus squalens]TBU43551.1 hypothetical protein BD309DRAFT_1031064 [Dichomitus squalens]TBU58587.1 hypothetical protein BD310DRAFT_926905 [Dichomitus squalens]
MVHLTNDLTALIGFACEATLWGGYAILFIVSIILLRRRSLKTELSTPVVVAHVALFIACTVHYALEFNHFYTTLAAKGVDGYANETTQLVGADIFLSLCDLLGDYILIYRCWALWGRNYWIIALPSMCAIAGFACIMQVVHYVVTLDPTSPTPPKPMLPLTLAGYSLPLCTNVMATALIIARIWWLSRPTPGTEGAFRSARAISRSAMATIVESGALYLAIQLTYVVLLSLENPVDAIVAVMAAQIYGIAPTLILIRVMLGLSVETTMEPGAATPMVWASVSKRYTTTHEQSKMGLSVDTGGSTAAGSSSTKVYHTDSDSVEMKPVEEV